MAVSNKGTKEKLLPWFSFIFTVFVFVIATFPQINPFNTDYLARAKSGDIHAQITLAHHYFELSDYTESAYWYNIATQRESEYKSLALNNLCYIYLTDDSINRKTNSFYDELLRKLKIAYQSGELVAAQNAYFLLNTLPKDYFTDHDWQTEFNAVIDHLERFDVYSQSRAHFYDCWKVIDTVIGEINTSYRLNSGGFVYDHPDTENGYRYFVNDVIRGKSNGIGDIDMTVEFDIYERQVDNSFIYFYISPQ